MVVVLPISQSMLSQLNKQQRTTIDKKEQEQQQQQQQQQQATGENSQQLPTETDVKEELREGVE
jgi:hypothetical protein